MPSSDYTSAVGGGLKLKGGSGVDKKKKKKSKSKSTETSKPASTSTSTDITERASPNEDDAADIPGRSLSPTTVERSFKEGGGRRQTEAERRHDEMRRKRLEERLKREGVKTHKEKVEELNKYLSGLSEHHDMPKIGPG